MGQKNTFFEKQSGEVIENTGKDYMDSQKQTGKQSGEVVENTYLWKKQTGNKATDLVENKSSLKNGPRNAPGNSSLLKAPTEPSSSLCG